MAFLSLLMRDIRLASRQGGALITSLGFYLIVVSAVPLGLKSEEARQLSYHISLPLLWVALLLSSLLTADRIFHDDYDDGSLEVIALGPMPLILVAFTKALAHWLTVGLPLLLLTPVLLILLNLNKFLLGPLMLTLVVGTPAVSFLASIGAALTLGIRKGGLLLPFIVLPLYVPLLIFGVEATKAGLAGDGILSPAFGTLCALSMASVFLSTFATAAALRMNLH
jgi:heme exporter protein B